MSLLIKALQKAEQNKSSNSEPSVTKNTSELELAPVDTSEMTDNASLETDFSDSSYAQSGTQQKHINQRAAATMLNVGQERYSGKHTRRGLLLALAVLLLIGAGFYLYLQSLQKPELVFVRSKTLPPAATSIQPAAPVQQTAISSEPITPVSEPLAPVPVPANPVQNVAVEQAATPVKTVAEPESAPVRQRHKSASHQPATETQPQGFGGTPVESDATGLKITRNASGTVINPNLMAAYQAFTTGDDSNAQRLYRQVLQNDVHNIDALLGMAAIASRQGRNDDAAGWYAKVLEQEPRNSLAQAALIGLNGQADPTDGETRLKTLLAQQPEAAHLHAALGNLYAEQNQWTSAQRAYFQAHRYAPNSPEYAFNLAVSLDHLGKSVLALQYYLRAQELSSQYGTGSIDRTQLESRIAQLQQVAR